MPADLKRKSPDLDLDALLADLDATVRASTRRPTTPVEAPQVSKPSSSISKRRLGQEKRERTRDFSALCEGLDEGVPGKPAAKNTRHTPSKHIIPAKPHTVSVMPSIASFVPSHSGPEAFHSTPPNDARTGRD